MPSCTVRSADLLHTFAVLHRMKTASQWILSITAQRMMNILSVFVNAAREALRA